MYNVWFCDAVSAGFVLELKAWVKAHGGVRLTFTPNTPVCTRDNHGKVLESFSFDSRVFVGAGLRFQGEILRAPGTYKQWQYIVPLGDSYEGLLEGFKPKVRHAIASTVKTGVSVSVVDTGDAAQLRVLADLLKATAERRSFSARDAGYYENFLRAFGEGGGVHVGRGVYAYGLIAYIDPVKTRGVLDKIIRDSEGVKDGADIIGKARRQLDAIEDLTEKTPVYAGFFVCTKREVVYLAGGGPDRPPGTAGPAIPARVLRWYAPTGHDRVGCDADPETDHRR